MSATPATDGLRELHEFYIRSVNTALEEGTDDVASELAADYVDDAVTMVSLSS